MRPRLRPRRHFPSERQLSDPDARFAIEAVLRATRLRDRATSDVRPDPAADAGTSNG
jgi:hypothetical protein